MTITEQGRAAMEEFGFSPVELSQPGAPTPGRIADRLSDIERKMADAIRSRDSDKALEAFGEMRRLRLALDAYDAAMLSVALRKEDRQ